MAVISEISGDSNEGDDLNKNPSDESKKAQEQQVAKTSMPLPDDMIVSILALFRRWDYPTLSFFCRDFRRLITSPELYKERLKLDNTDSVLYALISIPALQQPSWYILDKTRGSIRLRRIKNIDHVRYGSAVVTIGSHLFVIGGRAEYVSTPDVLLIDGRFHKYSKLTSMRRARVRAAAGVIDGKIYVIGGCEKRESDSDWVEVLDVKTQTWSPVPCPYTAISSDRAEFVTCAVMVDKIYVLGCSNSCCFTYEPKKDQWETLWGINDQWFAFNPLRSFWKQSSCVVDDVLFTFVPECSFRYPILSYDPKDNNYWRPVTILGRFPIAELLCYDSKMANSGGNLVILVRKKSGLNSNREEEKEIWCIEITLERQEDGEFRGTIITAEPVFTSSTDSYIDHCQTLTV